MKTKNKNILPLLVLFVILVWVVSGIIIYYLVPNWSDRGTVGDMFGAVNALYSGLAFVGLIYTIIMQREEIQLNRQEIEMNRKELKKSANAQLQSQKALQDQVLQTNLTTKINAMSTIINYYNIQIANPNNSAEIVERAKLKRKKLIHAIDELIEGVEDSDVDE